MTFSLPSPLLKLPNKDFKVPLRSNFSYSIFLHFRVEYDSLTHLPKFHPFTKIGGIFFSSFLFTILRPPLLGLVPEVKKNAWLKVAGSDVIDSTRDLHMANFHMELQDESTCPTSKTVLCCGELNNAVKSLCSARVQQ